MLAKNLGLPNQSARALGDGPGQRHRAVGGDGRSPHWYHARRPRHLQRDERRGRPAVPGLVFDATGIETSAGLVELQKFFTPLMRSL
jgi:3-oxoacyl-[acyl-carrier protein] reductase